MRAIRQILTDRILGTTMALLLAYVLVLQGLTGSYARASTFHSAQATLPVICASTGIIDAEPDNQQDPLKKSAECPCALLCRLANSTMPAILANPAITLGVAIAISEPAAYTKDTEPRRQPRRLLAQPRAPPTFS